MYLAFQMQRSHSVFRDFRTFAQKWKFEHLNDIGAVPARKTCLWVPERGGRGFFRPPLSYEINSIIIVADMLRIRKLVGWALGLLFTVVALPLVVDYWEKSNPIAADYETKIGTVWVYVVALRPRAARAMICTVILCDRTHRADIGRPRQKR